MTKFGKSLIVLVILAIAAGAWYFSSGNSDEIAEIPPSLKIGSSTFKGSVENIYYTFGGDHDERFEEVKEVYEEEDRDAVTLRENVDYVYLDNDAFVLLGQNPASGMSLDQILNCVSGDANKFLFIQYKNKQWNVYPKGPFGNQTVTISDIDAYKVYPGEAFITYTGDSATAFCMKKAETKSNARVTSLAEGWNMVAINENNLNPFLSHFPTAKNVWYLDDLNDAQPFNKYSGEGVRLSNYVAWIKSPPADENQGGGANGANGPVPADGANSDNAAIIDESVIERFEGLNRNPWGSWGDRPVVDWGSLRDRSVLDEEQSAGNDSEDFTYGAPQNLQVKEQGSDFAVLEWNSLAQREGYPIVSYEITVEKDGQSYGEPVEVISVQGSARSASTLTHLEPGEYNFRVAVVYKRGENGPEVVSPNAADQSITINGLSVVLGFLEPEDEATMLLPMFHQPPTNLQVSGYSGHVKLTWDKPQGEPPTSYWIYYTPHNGRRSPIPAIVTPNQVGENPTWILANIAPEDEVQYSFEVKALYRGVLSEAATDTFLVVPVPVPENFRVSGYSGHVKFEWENPSERFQNHLPSDYVIRYYLNDVDDTNGPLLQEWRLPRDYSNLQSFTTDDIWVNEDRDYIFQIKAVYEEIDGGRDVESKLVRKDYEVKALPTVELVLENRADDIDKLWDVSWQAPDLSGFGGELAVQNYILHVNVVKNGVVSPWDGEIVVLPQGFRRYIRGYDRFKANCYTSITFQLETVFQNVESFSNLIRVPYDFPGC